MEHKLQTTALHQGDDTGARLLLLPRADGGKGGGGGAMASVCTFLLSCCRTRPSRAEEHGEAGRICGEALIFPPVTPAELGTMQRNSLTGVLSATEAVKFHLGSTSGPRDVSVAASQKPSRHFKEQHSQLKGKDLLYKCMKTE